MSKTLKLQLHQNKYQAQTSLNNSQWASLS